MNATSRQKAAFAGPHLGSGGLVVDMGSGSGGPTRDLAVLNPRHRFIGVDINPEAVEHAARTYARAGLSFQVGDITASLFPDESVDTIVCSSTFHHPHSFCDPPFDTVHVRRGLDAQVRALKTGTGTLFVRDFVIPSGPSEVLLDLPTTDGGDAGADVPPTDASTASLFLRFCRDFRSSQNRDGPVPFEEVESAAAGVRRFRVSLRAATEFVLRKDYRDDWGVELLEEYLYFSQADFEEAFSERGLRVVVASEIHNPWIIENRFEGRVALRTLDGAPLPFPPTNFQICGEKVGPNAGVRLREVHHRVENAYLKRHAWKHQVTGEVWELVERPSPALDVIPFFVHEGHVFVAARKDYPRPIVNADDGSPRLDRATRAGYITEPIAAVVADPTISATLDVLRERAGVSSEVVLRVGPTTTILPSAGGIHERVVSRIVEIAPSRADEALDPKNHTGLVSAGSVRFLEATQILQMAQIGALFDARLEMNVYALLLERGASAGPWIGAELNPDPQAIDPSRIASFDEVLADERRDAFVAVPLTEATGFLEVRRGTFEEIGASPTTQEPGRRLGTVELEYALPSAATGLSTNTASGLPFVKDEEGNILVGIEVRELPAAAALLGQAALPCVPAWRLPTTVSDLTDARAHLTNAMEGDFGASVRRVRPLGGTYLPSAGCTPEQVFPFAVEVDASALADGRLTFVPLADLVARPERIVDGHLKVAALRLAHATGVIA